MTGTPFNSSHLSRRDILKMSGGALAAATGLSVVSGCNGDSVGKSGPTGGSLRFAYWGSSFEQKAIGDMLTDFGKQHPGSEVTPLYVPYVDYATKMTTMVASGSPPDVAYLDNVQLYQLADKDQLVNLYPYLNKYPQLADRLPTSYFWYGKDQLVASQLAEGVQILWFNKKSFADAGSDLPPGDAASAWTWDQFVAAAERTTLDTNGKRPTEPGFDMSNIRQFGTTAPLNSGFMYALLRSNGADMFDEAGTRYTLDSPAAVEVIQNMQDLIYKHRVAPTPAQLGKNAPTTTVQLQTRRIAMAVDGDWTLIDLGQSDLQYGCGVLPRYQKPLTTSGGAAGAVFKKTKNIDKAMELYAFYNDPAHVKLFSDGLWMPLQNKYYTDAASIAKWASGKIYPDNFKTAVIDPTVNNSVVWWAQSMKNSDKITQALTPAFDTISQGKQPAKEVLIALRSKIEPLLQGRWPVQQL